MTRRVMRLDWWSTAKQQHTIASVCVGLLHDCARVCLSAFVCYPVDRHERVPALVCKAGKERCRPGPKA